MLTLWSDKTNFWFHCSQLFFPVFPWRVAAMLMKNVIMPSQTYGFNKIWSRQCLVAMKIYIGAHKDGIRLSKVKPVVKYDKHKFRLCALNLNIRYRASDMHFSDRTKTLLSLLHGWSHSCQQLACHFLQHGSWHITVITCLPCSVWGCVHQNCTAFSLKLPTVALRGVSLLISCKCS